MRLSGTGSSPGISPMASRSREFSFPSSRSLRLISSIFSSRALESAKSSSIFSASCRFALVSARSSSAKQSSSSRFLAADASAKRSSFATFSRCPLRLPRPALWRGPCCRPAPVWRPAPGKAVAEAARPRVAAPERPVEVGRRCGGDGRGGSASAAAGASEPSSESGTALLLLEWHSIARRRSKSCIADIRASACPSAGTPTSCLSSLHSLSQE